MNRSQEISRRLVSVDALRGLVMFLMMAEVLNLAAVSEARPASGVWHFLAAQQEHAAWTGCSLHDLIQPTFSFLVGVVLPFSLASRAARGQSGLRMTLHAFWRALLLVLLGVFLRSLGQEHTNWTFEDTLTQIGLGYGFLFLLARGSARVQWTSLGLLLAGYWAAFALYPAPGANFNYAAAGVPPDWPHRFSGFAAHWNKNSNLAWAFDTWFLNLFPRESRFAFNEGGYATLSFIPTLGTMILGLVAGGILRSPRTDAAKVKWLLWAGGIGLVSGLVLGGLGICPVVKRIWTPSWVLFSGGWSFLLLAFFYTLLDLRGHKSWAFPLVVIGMNSIAAYCLAHLVEDFVAAGLERHLGASVFQFLGHAYAPLLQGAAVLAVLWLVLFWMYRRKLFLRI